MHPGMGLTEWYSRQKVLLRWCQWTASSVRSTPVSASQAGDWPLVRFGLDFLIICYLVLSSTAAPDFLTTVTTGLDTTPTVWSIRDIEWAAGNGGRRNNKQYWHRTAEWIQNWDITRGGHYTVTRVRKLKTESHQTGQTVGESGCQSRNAVDMSPSLFVECNLVKYLRKSALFGSHSLGHMCRAMSIVTGPGSKTSSQVFKDIQDRRVVFNFYTF